ncbi:hypothetical protein TGRUB_292035 [Toxoplasma gondii RUB]|uniref:Uncharacterized protein n=1 Tax=Toxoplasma gondii RUB TaxID=935652 RepID=A0A086M1Y3_TOXGO|nr:hypothetical protein TGRUB_292035 [Toxoplasma gondii RUB]
MKPSSWRRPAGHATRLYGSALVSRPLSLSKATFAQELQRVSRVERRTRGTTTSLSNVRSAVEQKRDTDGLRLCNCSRFFRRAYHKQPRRDGNQPVASVPPPASPAPPLSYPPSEEEDAACLSIFERIYRAKSHPSPSASVGDASPSSLLSSSRCVGDAAASVDVETEVEEDADRLPNADCESDGLPASLPSVDGLHPTRRSPVSSSSSVSASSPPSANSPVPPLTSSPSSGGSHRPVPRRLSKLSCHVLVCMLADLARSGVRTREAWQPLLLLLLQSLPRLSAQQIQQTVLALSQAGLCAPVVLQGLSEALYWKCEQKKALPDNLVLLLDALRRLRYCPSTRHLNKYIERMKDGRKKLTVSHCLKLLRFFAEAGVDAGDLKYPEFYWGLYARLTSGFSSLHPAEVAATAQLLAQLGVRDSQFFDHLCRALYNRSADIVNTNVAVASRVDEALEASRSSPGLPLSPIIEVLRSRRAYGHGLLSSSPSLPSSAPSSPSSPCSSSLSAASLSASSASSASSLAFGSPVSRVSPLAEGSRQTQWSQTVLGAAAFEARPGSGAEEAKPISESDQFFAALVHLGRTLLHIKTENPPVHFWLAMKHHLEHHWLSLRPEHTVFTLSFLARYHHRDTSLLNKLGLAVERNLLSFSPNELASILFSFSSLAYRHRTLHATLAFRLLQGSASPDLGCLDDVFLHSVSPLVRLPGRPKRAQTRPTLPEGSLPFPFLSGNHGEGVNEPVPDRLSSTPSLSRHGSLPFSIATPLLAQPPCLSPSSHPAAGTSDSVSPVSPGACKLASPRGAEREAGREVLEAERQGHLVWSSEGGEGNTHEFVNETESSSRTRVSLMDPKGEGVGGDSTSEAGRHQTGSDTRRVRDSESPSSPFLSYESVWNNSAFNAGERGGQRKASDGQAQPLAADAHMPPPMFFSVDGRSTDRTVRKLGGSGSTVQLLPESRGRHDVHNEGFTGAWSRDEERCVTRAGQNFDSPRWVEGREASAPLAIRETETGASWSGTSESKEAGDGARDGRGQSDNSLAWFDGEVESRQISLKMPRPASFVPRRIEPAVAAAMLDACVELKYRDRLFLACLTASLKVAVEETGVHSFGTFVQTNGIVSAPQPRFGLREGARVAGDLPAAGGASQAEATWSETTCQRVYGGGADGRGLRAPVGLHEVASKMVWTPDTPNADVTLDGGSDLRALRLQAAGRLCTDEGRPETASTTPTSSTMPARHQTRYTKTSVSPESSSLRDVSHKHASPSAVEATSPQAPQEDTFMFLSEFDPSQIDSVRPSPQAKEADSADSHCAGEGRRLGEATKGCEASTSDSGDTPSAGDSLSPSLAAGASLVRPSSSRSVMSSALFPSSASGVMRFRYTRHFFDLLRRAALRQGARRSADDWSLLSKLDVSPPEDRGIADGRQTGCQLPHAPSQEGGEQLEAACEGTGGVLLASRLRKSTKGVVGRCASFIPADASIERRIHPDQLRRRFWDRLFETTGHPAKRRLYHRRLFLAACELRFQALPSRPLRLSPVGLSGQGIQTEVQPDEDEASVSGRDALPEKPSKAKTKAGLASERPRGESEGDVESVEGREQLEGTSCVPFRDCGVLGRRQRQRQRAASVQRPKGRKGKSAASSCPEDNAFRDAQTVRNAMRRWSLLRRAFLEPYEDHARALQVALCRQKLSERSGKLPPGFPQEAGETEYTSLGTSPSTREPANSLRPTRGDAGSETARHPAASHSGATSSCAAPGLSLLFLPRPHDGHPPSRLPFLVDTVQLLPAKRLFEGHGTHARVRRGVFLAESRLAHMQARILRDNARSRDRVTRHRMGGDDQYASVKKLDEALQRRQNFGPRARILLAHAETTNETGKDPSRFPLPALDELCAANVTPPRGHMRASVSAEDASFVKVPFATVRDRQQTYMPSEGSLACSAHEAGAVALPRRAPCAAGSNDDAVENGMDEASKARQKNVPLTLRSIRPLCPLVREVACALEASVRLHFLPPGLLTAFASHLLHIVTNVSAVICSPSLVGVEAPRRPRHPAAELQQSEKALQAGDEASHAVEEEGHRRVRVQTKTVFVELSNLLRCLTRAADAACCVPGTAAADAENENGNEEEAEHHKADARPRDVKPFPEEQQRVWKILEKCFRAAAFEALWNPEATFNASSRHQGASPPDSVPFVSGLQRSDASVAAVPSDPALLLHSLRVYSRLAHQLTFSSGASFLSADCGGREQKTKLSFPTEDATLYSRLVDRPPRPAPSCLVSVPGVSGRNTCEDGNRNRTSPLFLSHGEWGRTLLDFIGGRLGHSGASQREKETGRLPARAHRDSGDNTASSDKGNGVSQASSIAGEPGVRGVDSKRERRQAVANAEKDSQRRPIAQSLGIRELTQILNDLSRLRPLLMVDSKEVDGDSDRLWQALHAETKCRLLSALRNDGAKHAILNRSSQGTTEPSAVARSSGDFHRRDLLNGLVALCVDALPPRFHFDEELTSVQNRRLASSLPAYRRFHPGLSRSSNEAGDCSADEAITAHQGTAAGDTASDPQDAGVWSHLRAPQPRDERTEKPTSICNEEQLFGQTVRKLARRSAVPTRLLLRAVHRELTRQGRWEAATFVQQVAPPC